MEFIEGKNKDFTSSSFSYMNPGKLDKKLRRNKSDRDNTEYERQLKTLWPKQVTDLSKSDGINGILFLVFP